MENKLTQEEILNLYIDTLPLIDGEIDKELMNKMFQELSKVEYFLEWIDLIAAQDIKNVFNAQNDKIRDTLRGMNTRIIDIKARCIKSNDIKLMIKY